MVSQQRAESSVPQEKPDDIRRVLRVRRLGRVQYATALELQESLVAAKIAGDETDELLLLEHEPVYTLGRGADAADLRGAADRLRVPVFRVGRGGGATFHGPGQLVAYPIVHLHPRRDVHRYVRALEQTLIETCAAFGVEAAIRPGETGVWAGQRKIASIGIGVRRGVAFHGVALNVSTDVSYFEQIVACRMPGMEVTTLERQLGCAVPLESVEATFVRCFTGVMGYTLAN